MPTNNALIISVLCSAVVIGIWRVRYGLRRHPHPPGPAGLPLVDNIFDMPAHHEWLVYFDWARKYGPLVSISVLGQRIVFLNNVKLEKDLFEGKPDVYSDHPVPTMTKLTGLNLWLMGLMSPTPEWRRARRAILHTFASQKLHQYQPHQQREVCILLRHLLQTPDDFRGHIERFINSVMLSVCYGHKVPNDGPDQLLDMHMNVLKLNSKFFTGTYLVNILPFLRFIPSAFPGGQFHKDAQASRPKLEQVLNYPTDMIRQNPTSFTTSMVSNLLDEGEMDDFTIKSSAATSYNASIAGSNSQLLTFMLCMVLFPEVQKKASDEIDRSTGGKRLPEFTDRRDMPYCEMLLKELHRWHPMDPIGLPHMTTADDIVNGFLIPKGSVVASNIWYQGHDESVYKNPAAFHPDRYLGDKPEPILDAFGSGQRSCPGRHLAESNVWLCLVSILAMFDLQKKRGVDGNLIVPTTEYTTGISVEPIPFECAITPRSAQHAQLINNLAEAVE